MFLLTNKYIVKRFPNCNYFPDFNENVSIGTDGQFPQFSLFDLITIDNCNYCVKIQTSGQSTNFFLRPYGLV